MKGGIPQGSALGPLLFLVYMYEFIAFENSQMTRSLLLQYADDTILIMICIVALVQIPLP